jgi:hypothetical protein
MQFYNLGYPVMSLAKDLLLLSYAINYQPDLVIWLVTLESFPYDKQLFSPLLQNNPDALKELLNRYLIKLDPNDPSFHQPSFWDRTLPGSRRQLADLIRLQLYGILWAATGIDQDIPSSFTARQEDLSADQIFHELEPPHLNPSDLAFDVLSAGIKRAAPTPVMIVNEPMFISQGLNSHIRYNYYYPRWAYDDYSQLMKDISSENGWIYLDFWDKIAASEFTNTAVHLSPRGSHQLATLLADALQDLAP